MVYKEIKHLSMLKDVKQVVEIIEVVENGKDMYIIMEVRLQRHCAFVQASLSPKLVSFIAP